MGQLHCERLGDGKISLVLIHGWGMNSVVWKDIADTLSPHFTLYLLDLPGFGLSAPSEDMSLASMAEQIRQQVPRDSIWLGWSLGGLIAQQAALNFPHELKALITVASSAHFIEQEAWAGIKPSILGSFAEGLEQNYTRTLQQFLSIQAMGCEHAKQDIKQLRALLKQRPMPDLSALRNGLSLLAQSDLRSQNHLIRVPWLQLYGRQDALVPKAAMAQHQALNPQAQQYCFTASSHAPFMSEKHVFSQQLQDFSLGLL